MTRALWFFLKLGVLVAAAVWLADHPGRLSVAWQGYVVEMSVSVAVVTLVILVVGAVLLFRGWSAVRRAPAAFVRHRRGKRRESGYRALTRGMVAVAAGDPVTALRMARRADVLLNEPPLTMLLSAQAAQLNGDDDAARRYFQAMLDRPETAFLGLRGLLTQALRAGKRPEALEYARKAQALQPRTPWLLATLFDLEARNGAWEAAEDMLRSAVNEGAMTPEDGRHHRAALFLEQSLAAERDGRIDEAIRLAGTAHGVLPGFVPAAVRLAKLHLAAGDPRRAIRIVTRTWKHTPHPELAEVLFSAIATTDPLERYQDVRKLAAQAPANAESLIVLATAGMEAKLWGEARSQLQKALAQHPSRRVFGLLARLERAERGDEMAARAWLAQAASAPTDPAWTCRSCGSTATMWTGRCGSCGAFDTLDWRTPSVTLSLGTSAAVPKSGVPTVIEATR